VDPSVTIENYILSLSLSLSFWDYNQPCGWISYSSTFHKILYPSCISLPVYANIVGISNFDGGSKKTSTLAGLRNSSMNRIGIRVSMV